MDLGKLRRKLGVYFLSYYYFFPKKILFSSILFSVTATIILTHTHNVSESDSNICIQLCTTEKNIQATTPTAGKKCYFFLILAYRFFWVHWYILRTDDFEGKVENIYARYTQNTCIFTITQHQHHVVYLFLYLWLISTCPL